MRTTSIPWLVFMLALLVGVPEITRSQAQAGQGTSLAAQAASSTAAVASPVGSKADVRAGTKISAMLGTRIDARAAKVGEKVVARVMKNVKQNGRIVVRKGDEIVGHVTAVQEGTYKAGSHVAIDFDQLLSGGMASRLNTVLSQVVALPGHRARVGSDFDEPMTPAGMPGRRAGTSGTLGGSLPGAGSGEGGLGGGVSGSVGGTAGTLGQTVNASLGTPTAGVSDVTGTARNAKLADNARVGLSTPLAELHVSSEVQGGNRSGANSVLSSHHGNLRLDSGTYVQFRVTAESRAQSTRN